MWEGLGYVFNTLNLRCALSRVSQFCSCVKARRPIRRSTAVMSELPELDTLTALPWEVLEYILSCLSAEDLGRQAPSASGILH